MSDVGQADPPPPPPPPAFAATCDTQPTTAEGLPTALVVRGGQVLLSTIADVTDVTVYPPTVEWLSGGNTTPAIAEGFPVTRRLEPSFYVNLAPKSPPVSSRRVPATNGYGNIVPTSPTTTTNGYDNLVPTTSGDGNLAPKAPPATTLRDILARVDNNERMLD